MKYNISSINDYLDTLEQTNNYLKSLINKREVINSNITKCNNEILKFQSKFDIKNRDIEDLNFRIKTSYEIFMESL